MNIKVLLAKLYKLGIKVNAKNGQLKILSKQSHPSAEALELINSHKMALLSHFESSQVPSNTGLNTRLTAEQKSQGVEISPLQWSLWPIYKLGKSSHYNIPLCFDLRSLSSNKALDIEKLLNSFTQLYCHCDAFHSHFVESEEKVFMKPSVDLNWKPTFRVGCEKDLASIYQEERYREFDLTADPLLVVHLIQISDSHSVVIVNFPHIVMDGWSVNVFWQHVSAYYNDTARPDKGNDFYDYLANLEPTNNSYWEQRLAGYEPTPIHSHGEITHQISHIYYTDLSKTDVSALKHKARSSETSVFSVALKLWGETVAVYLGQPEVVISTPFVNREKREWINTLGYVATMIPVRVGLDQKLAEFQQSLNEDLSYPYFNQPQLLSALSLHSETGRNALQEVIFSIQDDSNEISAFDEVSVVRREAQVSQSKFPLSLTLQTTDDGFRLKWEFDTTLLSRDTVTSLEELFLLHIRGESVPWPPLCDSFAAGPDVLTLLEKCVNETPDSLALRANTAAFTYKELWQSAHKIAAKLQAGGVRKGEHVGVCLPRNCDLIIAIVGIIRAGCVYVPLSEKDSESRLSSVTKACGMRVCLSEKRPITSLNYFSVKEILDAESLPFKPVTLSETDPIYINFSSGTTGEPKGIVCLHQGVVRLVRDPGFVKLDNLTQMACVSASTFDAFTFECWGALLNGGCLHVLDEKVVEPTSLEQMINEGVNIALLTTALFHSFVDINPIVFNGLKVIVVGGDVLSSVHAQTLYKHNPEIVLINGYGPTENTTFTSCFEVPRDWPETTALPIGYAINNTEILILGDDDSPLLPGCVGELVTTGKGVALGYLDSEQNMGRFINLPVNGVKAYRTGDLATIDKNGLVRFVGRKDQQAKINGYRVEPEAVNNALRRLPKVKNSAVLVQQREELKQLVCYLVAQDGEELSAREIADLLAQTLPYYMVPEAYIFLDSLPVTRHGKVDFRVLKNMTVDIEESYSAPTTEAEVLLCQIWADVLSVEKVGVDDSFFKLGGSSISALKVIAKVQQLYNKSIELKDFFELKTVRRIGTAMEQGSNHNLFPIKAVTIPSHLNPVSNAQSRLYYIDAISAEPSLYHVPFVFELQQATTALQLEKAANNMLERHKVLRSVYLRDDNNVLCQKDSELRLEVATYSATNHVDLCSIVEELCESRFDLSSDIPIKIALIKYAEQSLVFFKFHHIAFDGWSLAILLKEMFGGNTESMQPELNIQYADYAAWESQLFNSELYQKQQAFWQNSLKNIEQLNLPKRLGKLNDQCNGRETLAISPELSRALINLAKEQGITLYSVLLSGFYLVMSAFSGQKDIVVGCPSDNRHHSKLQSLIGCFVNVLPLRVNIDTSISVTSYLQNVADIVGAAKAHQDFPFEKMVELAGVSGDKTSHPIFQVMFSVQEFESGIDFSALSLKPVDLEKLVCKPLEAKYDLSVTIENAKDDLRAIVSYKANYYESELVNNVLQTYLHVLQQMVTRPSDRLQNLPWISTSQQQEAVNHSTRKVNYDLDKTLYQLFEEQTKRTPDKLALLCGEQCLTYTQLLNKVMALAGYLKKQQLYRDESITSYVALKLPRGIDMVVSILATLKIGAAYVPLEPSWPADRVAHILKDTGAFLLITDNITNDLLNAETTSDSQSTQAFDMQVMDIDKFNDTHEHCEDSETQAVNERDIGLASGNYVSPDSTAYVIYTSGTSGKPKGVAITHRSAVNLAWNLQEQLSQGRFGEAEEWCWNAAYIFDASVQGLLQLCMGRSLNVLTDELKKDPQKLLQQLQSRPLSILDCTPSFAKQLLKLISFEKGLMLPNLVIGGEPINQTLWDDIAISCQRFGVDALNVYGPTECTVNATYANILVQTPPNIGVPLNNVTTLVLDDQQRVLPHGAFGELYIAGECVAKEYLRQPKLTQANFITLPHLSDNKLKSLANTIFYRTGDKVRYLQDGNLDCIGRLDAQLKIRGYRIEPMEIVKVLEGIPNVLQAACIPAGIEDAEYLLAFIVPKLKDSAPDATELQLILRETLPEYMLPRYVHVVDALPLTVNGKLDSRALLEHAVTPVDRNVCPPSSEIGQQLAQLWCEILNTAEVDIRDDFFGLGGNSLLLITLQFEINRSFNVSINLNELFNSSCFYQQETLLEQTVGDMHENCESFVF